MGYKGRATICGECPAKPKLGSIGTGIKERERCVCGGAQCRSRIAFVCATIGHLSGTLRGGAAFLVGRRPQPRRAGTPPKRKKSK